jgi:hypothetical protein
VVASGMTAHCSLSMSFFNSTHYLVPCPPYMNSFANRGGLIVCCSSSPPRSFICPSLYLAFCVSFARLLNSRCIAIEHAAGPNIFVFTLYIFCISAFSCSDMCSPPFILVDFRPNSPPPIPLFCLCADSSQAVVPGSTFNFLSPIPRDNASILADTAGPSTCTTLSAKSLV